MRHGANFVSRIIITSHVVHDFGYSHTDINHGLCCTSPAICPIRLRAPVITVPRHVEYYPRMLIEYYCPNMFKMFEAISAAIPSLASCASVMLQLSNVLLRLALRPDLRLPSAAR